MQRTFEEIEHEFERDFSLDWGRGLNLMNIEEEQPRAQIENKPETLNTNSGSLNANSETLNTNSGSLNANPETLNTNDRSRKGTYRLIQESSRYVSDDNDPEKTTYYKRTMIDDNGHVKEKIVQKKPGQEWRTDTKEYDRAGRALEAGEQQRYKSPALQNNAAN